MEFLDWVGLKLLGVVAVVISLLALLYTATAIFPWLFAMKSPEIIMIVRLLVMSVTALALISLFHEYLPEFYEWTEQELLEELIIHEHPPLFRFTLVLGAVGLFVASMLLHFHWPFAIGVMIGGTVAWLFVVDIAAAIFVSGLEGIEEIGGACHSENIVSTQILGLGLVLLSGVLSWFLYQGVMWKAPAPVMKPLGSKQQTGLWPQVQNFFSELKKSAEKSWQGEKSTPQPAKRQVPALKDFPQLQHRLHKMLEKSKVDEIKKLLQELRQQKNNRQDKECIDSILLYLDEKQQDGPQ